MGQKKKKIETTKVKLRDNGREREKDNYLKEKKRDQRKKYFEKDREELIR
jgi:hypothetical protein